ncbi:class I SAM-dependent methyltransferase [Algoriphagus sp. H41]|uniref:Class I SAM-dependent methyltransferase n=1 Tax=Algoriphagus oliviformis TaxID=2811231 RepID=A0ABS3C9V3_9BACT|nr:class I SAM-dependent methyltransferase [Algoriphagus oliviformis]MBN7812950.1 class I SAM-dependent methyltransferase [Algoriphagus oliviformis]
MEYPGNELELFENAINWKAYFAFKLSPYIKGHVAEVGAGIGGSTTFLFNSQVKDWTCFEPDLRLFKQLKRSSDSWSFNSQLILKNGFLPDEINLYDTILYIDVLEHIANDKEELEKALTALRKGGNLIVLVPAFKYLFSPFDVSVGHFRRYTKAMLKSLVPNSLNNYEFFYLDSLGFVSSLVNKWVLKQAYPSLQQIQFWDRVLVPMSKVLDPIHGHSFGKSLVMRIEK